MAPRRTYPLSAVVSDPAREALKKYSPLAQQLLYNRGIDDAIMAEEFLNPNYETGLHDPFLFTDMERATERILRAIQNNEHIVIYTDYDCDGIPGGVVLHDFFTAIGYSNFENYIPHRHHEGYGFNAASVEGFKERDAKLIITVDCGIVDHEAALAAKKCGIDVIITDHHEPSETLPEAYAVINPKRDDAYPFKGICGTGVAYKLAQATLVRGKEQGVFTIKDGMEKWWLDMVGLATIADMVPITGENRILAHYGLQVLRKSTRPGLKHLLRTAGGNQKYLTEDDIGFTIAPRINAASRMDNPEDAFHMLSTKDEAEAGERVRHLEKLNNERKGVVAAMTKEAKKKMHNLVELPSVIVMGNPEWRPSLVGLVANSLVEEYRRPVFLWGRDGRDIIKGSCRSDGTVSTLMLMEAAADSFLFFGGHHGAGGFSVHEERIHTLQDAMNDAYIRLGDKVKEVNVDKVNAESGEGDLGQDREAGLGHVAGREGALGHKVNVAGREGALGHKVNVAGREGALGHRVFSDVHETQIDADLRLEDIDSGFLRTLASLAPYGEGNPKPIFKFTNIIPKRVLTFGGAKNHTKLLFETEQSTVEAIVFFKTPEQFDVPPVAGKSLSLIAHVEESYFMGRKQVRLRIVDII